MGMRDELTAEWRERGAEEDQRSAVPPSRSEDGREFAILTDILHQGTFDVSTDDHRAVKALKKRDSLRDNMTSLELALTMLSEATSTTPHQARDSEGFVQLQRDAHEAGGIAGGARQQIEAATGQPVVRGENAKALTARAQQPHLFAPEDASD